MSAITTPAPPAAGVPTPPPPPAVVATRRTALGFVATRRVVEVILMVILGVGSGLLFYGSHFGLNMVHSQLAAQQITFPTKAELANPPKGSTEITPGMKQYLYRYGGMKLTTGPEAKAYADHFIAVHLSEIDNGQTYSQVSAASIAAPTNTTLSADVATIFKGQTLRGLLLYAWGWSVVSTLALYAAIGAAIGFVIMLAVTVGDFVADPKIAAHHISQS
jgi:hypothetical protein